MKCGDKFLPCLSLQSWGPRPILLQHLLRGSFCPHCSLGMQLTEPSPRAQESKASCPDCRQSRTQASGRDRRLCFKKQHLEDLCQHCSASAAQLSLIWGLLTSRAAREVKSRFSLVWYQAPSSLGDSSRTWEALAGSYMKAPVGWEGLTSCSPAPVALPFFVTGNK